MTDQPKKKCFVVAPIGKDGSPDRIHSDTVLKYIINPVLEQLGFSSGERADHLGTPGIITTQILKRIAEDDLVIADLTGQNPNVFYELAIRHGTGKPFIQMIKHDQDIPFDVGQQRTIKFDAGSLAGGEAAKIELKKHIEASLAPDFQMETPLGHAFDLQALRTSGGSVERSLALIVEKLDGLARRHAYDKAVRHDPVPTRTIAPIRTTTQSDYLGNMLLKALIPDYDPETARQVIENLNSGIGHLQERFQEWLREAAEKRATVTPVLPEANRTGEATTEATPDVTPEKPTDERA